MKTNLKLKYLFHILILITLFLNQINYCNGVKLKGVTIPNWPYVERYEDPNTGGFKYNGFLIDLLQKITEYWKYEFEFEFYYAPDGNYGSINGGGRINGMIGELYNGRADFAVADLTVNEERRRFVDFTEPYMKSRIAALIHKSNVGNMQSFGDLLDQTEVKYGAIAGSHTFRYFQESRNQIIRKMYSFMVQNSEVLVQSYSNGIQRVNTTKYALIMDSAPLEFAAGTHCNLTVINDTMHEFKDFTRNYAIAFRRGHRYLAHFDKAINELKKNGQLDELKNSYWVNDCDNELDINSSLSLNSSHQYLALILFLIIFSFRAFSL